MLISENLLPETVEMADRAENSTAVIRLLSARLAPGLSQDPAVLERAVISRERARTTALANGAAIPHCRLAGVRRFCCALMVLQTPLRWDNEGHAVDTVLLIAGPSENVSDHLRILANASQILDSPSLRAKLKRAPDPHRAVELIAAAEEAIEVRRQEAGMLRELRDVRERQAGDFLTAVTERFPW